MDIDDINEEGEEEEVEDNMDVVLFEKEEEYGIKLYSYKLDSPVTACCRWFDSLSTTHQDGTITCWLIIPQPPFPKISI